MKAPSPQRRGPHLTERPIKSGHRRPGGRRHVLSTGYGTAGERGCNHRDKGTAEGPGRGKVATRPARARRSAPPPGGHLLGGHPAPFPSPRPR